MIYRVRSITSSMCTALSLAAFALFIVLSPKVSQGSLDLTPLVRYCACGCVGGCSDTKPDVTFTTTNINPTLTPVVTATATCPATCGGGCGWITGNCFSGCGCIGDVISWNFDMNGNPISVNASCSCK